MSLALVSVSTTDYDWIRDHLLNRDPRYSNMHLREACQRNRRRDLRYLHAMHVDRAKPTAIEGMISGPGVYWHYRLIRAEARTQLNVLTERGTSAALDRISRRFLREVMDRITHERSGVTHYPRRTSGQYYLRRGLQGMPASHPNCQRAVAAGVLDAAFVARLAPWKLQLLHP